MSREATKGDLINKAGALRYNDAATRKARSGESEKDAREAADALEGPEGRELKRAAREGKAAAKQPRR